MSKDMHEFGWSISFVRSKHLLLLVVNLMSPNAHRNSRTNQRVQSRYLYRTNYQSKSLILSFLICAKVLLESNVFTPRLLPPKLCLLSRQNINK